MKKKDFIINNEFAHYYFLKSDGDDAHFYPGNGLQNGVYKPLLNLLAEKYNLTSLAYRASWQGSPKQKNQVDWNVYADDLISFLDQKYKKPITAIGHSQGATATLMAATKRPDLFKELFLIEPVSVTKAQEIAIGLVPYFIKKKAEPFKSGLKKKPIWKSPEEYLDFLESSKGFKRIGEEELKIFSQESLRFRNDNSYELIFPIDWEVANYALPININTYLKQVEVPYKIIMGKPSFFLNEKVRSKLKDIVKGEIIINENYGHLIPLEAPEFCAAQILE